MTRSRTLGLVAPSGFLPDPKVIDRAARFFSGQGWRVIAGESVFAREQRFAGNRSDGQRGTWLRPFHAVSRQSILSRAQICQ